MREHDQRVTLRGNAGQRRQQRKQRRIATALTACAAFGVVFSSDLGNVQTAVASYEDVYLPQVRYATYRFSPGENRVSDRHNKVVTNYSHGKTATSPLGLFELRNSNGATVYRARGKGDLIVEHAKINTQGACYNPASTDTNLINCGMSYGGGSAEVGCTAGSLVEYADYSAAAGAGISVPAYQDQATFTAANPAPDPYVPAAPIDFNPTQLIAGIEEASPAPAQCFRAVAQATEIYPGVALRSGLLNGVPCLGLKLPDLEAATCGQDTLDNLTLTLVLTQGDGSNIAVSWPDKVLVLAPPVPIYEG